MNAAEPLCPMAIPFKVAHFHLKRRNELKQQLSRSRLFRAMEEATGAGTANRNILREAREGFLLPRGAHAALDEALLRLWTVARLTLEAEVRMRVDKLKPLTCLAARDNGTLVINLPAALLEGVGVPTLVHHLAVATFFAMDTTPRTLYLLIKAKVPFYLEDRLKAYEIARLTEYAADCFALVCTGDLELTVREGFFHVGVAGPYRPAIDLRVVARHHLYTGDLTMGSLIETNRCRFDYPPLKPLILEQFQASELYRSCHGKPGGITRAAFEATVLEMEQKAHPPMRQMPVRVWKYFRQVLALSIFAGADATGPVSEERRQRILLKTGFSEAELQTVAAEVGWDGQAAGDARDHLKRLLEIHEGAANVHAVELIGCCLLLAVQENDGHVPEAVEELLYEIGGWCCLTCEEVKAVRLALAADILAGNGPG